MKGLRIHRRAFSFAAQFQWEPRDLWIGAFWRLNRYRAQITGWDREHGNYIGQPWTFHLYVCLVPLLPLHITVTRWIRPEGEPQP